MITLKIKENFFDRRKVIEAMDKKSLRAKSRAGAFVRRRAQTSMRKRKRPSPPGKPPSVHQGDLRRLILFAYEPATQGVLVGPIAFNQKAYIGNELVSGPVPSVLEFGGVVGIRETLRSGWKTGLSNRRRQGKPQRIRRAAHAARPYMGPALEMEVAKGTILAQWGGSLKGN